MRLRATLALLLAASGCQSYSDPCFTPPGRVEDLRVLAVRADPPEASTDLEIGAVDPLHVTVLLGDAQDIRDPIGVSARLCAPTEDRRCPEGSPVVATAMAFATATFDVHASAALLSASLAADPLHGYGGIRLQLEVEAARPPGAPVARATKLLLYSQVSPAHVPNHGLEVVALQILRGGAPAEQLRDGEVLNTEVGTTVGLRPILGPGPGALEAQELYQVTDLSGRTLTLREHASYSFFVTPHNAFGKLTSGLSSFADTANADVADEPQPGTPDPPDGLTQLTSFGDGGGRLWIVARDGRGAEAWLSVALAAVDNRGGRKRALDFGCL